MEQERAVLADLLLVKLEELAVAGVERVEMEEITSCLVQLRVGGDGEGEEGLD